MSKLLGGANWWTTLWGIITTVAGVIAIHPEVLVFLPQSWMPTISGIALFIGFLSGTTFSYAVKSKDVTGGKTQQTYSGAVAAPGTQTLVDQTVKASVASGEEVPVEVERKANT